jgi:salicylate hydroxylase
LNPPPSDFAGRRVLIAGAGIGGLAAALCFQQRRWHVTVLEQAEYLRSVGAGIQLSPNAMKVLRALGLEAEIIRAGFVPEALELRLGESGFKLIRMPINETDAAGRMRWSAPYIHIHRAELQRVLAEALHERAPGSLQLSARFSRYEQDGTGIRALLEDGTSRSADVLVGADGVHSVLQAQMLGKTPAAFTGNVAWRAVVPMQALGGNVPPPTACAWLGKGRHAVTYRLSRGPDALANLVAVVEQSGWQDESWTAEGTREEALKDFAGWHPVVRKLIENAETLNRWALFDRPPLARWSDGRAVLMGDAAHPMLPFVAQGAAMAIEDAFVLAQSFEGQKSAAASLQTFEAQRHVRTTRVQKASRDNARLFHLDSPVDRLKAYGLMWLAGRVAPAAGLARNDWIYSHDVTAGSALEA